jgi:hypothetical protein
LFLASQVRRMVLEKSTQKLTNRSNST